MQIQLLLFSITLLVSCTEGQRPSSNQLVLATNIAPPLNPFLAHSPWPMSHGSSYNQKSSDLSGPTNDNLQVSQLQGEPVSITLPISQSYRDGESVIWGNTPNSIYKINSHGENLNYLQNDQRVGSSDHLSGAYSVIDKNNHLFIPKDLKIERYFDNGDREGKINSQVFELSSIDRFYVGELIVGMNLSYDGYLIFVTNFGTVGVLARDFSDYRLLRLDTYPTEISNSIAVDESGGIFILTKNHAYRVNWNGRDLTIAWKVAYESDDFEAPGRLGKGSGTTPALMGTGDEDKFVVFTDGKKVMNMILLWRDQIPEDWSGLSGEDRRLAAKIPVSFGFENPEKSITEQSVVINGYDAAVVSNVYGYIGERAERYIKLRYGHDLNRATIYLSNWWGESPHRMINKYIAPWGVQKFSWDPNHRKLNVAWSQPTISCPNGIPAMSRTSGLIYCIGQRNSRWSLEGIDWQTGESKFSKILTTWEGFNSFYSAIQIGFDGSIITSTYGGTLKFSPK